MAANLFLPVILAVTIAAVVVVTREVSKVDPLAWSLASGVILFLLTLFFMSEPPGDDVKTDTVLWKIVRILALWGVRTRGRKAFLAAICVVVTASVMLLGLASVSDYRLVCSGHLVGTDGALFVGNRIKNCAYGKESWATIDFKLWHPFEKGQDIDFQCKYRPIAGRPNTQPTRSAGVSFDGNRMMIKCPPCPLGYIWDCRRGGKSCKCSRGNCSNRRYSSPDLKNNDNAVRIWIYEEETVDGCGQFEWIHRDPEVKHSILSCEWRKDTLAAKT